MKNPKVITNNYQYAKECVELFSPEDLKEFESQKKFNEKMTADEIGTTHEHFINSINNSFGDYLVEAIEFNMDYLYALTALAFSLGIIQKRIDDVIKSYKTQLIKNQENINDFIRQRIKDTPVLANLIPFQNLPASNKLNVICIYDIINKKRCEEPDLFLDIEYTVYNDEVVERLYKRHIPKEINSPQTLLFVQQQVEKGFYQFVDSIFFIYFLVRQNIKCDNFLLSTTIMSWYNLLINIPYIEHMDYRYAKNPKRFEASSISQKVNIALKVYPHSIYKEKEIDIATLDYITDKDYLLLSRIVSDQLSDEEHEDITQNIRNTLINKLARKYKGLEGVEIRQQYMYDVRVYALLAQYIKAFDNMDSKLLNLQAELTKYKEAERNSRSEQLKEIEKIKADYSTRLNSERERIKAEFEKVYEEKINSLNSSIFKKDKEIADLKETIALYDDEQEELKSLRTFMFNLDNESDENNELKKEIVEEVKEILKNKNVACFGGHDIWINNLKTLFPDWTYYGVKYSTIKTSEKLDYIVLMTNHMSHSQYYQIMNNRGKETKILYCSKTNLDLIAQELYSQLV